MMNRASLCRIAVLLCILHLSHLIDSTYAQSYLTEKDFLAPLYDDDAITLSDDDFDNARKLSTEMVNSQKKRRVLSHQKYYRGDIRGRAAWTSKLKSGVRRNGVTSVIKRWPNGRIPYVISSQYNERERAVLARAFQEYHSRTCIRFVPRTSFDQDYLYIGKIDGCYSDVGRAGGRQELSLDDGCLQYNTAIHELMHSVGFYHEHERWDRDQYITILWNNIDKDAYDQFGRVDLTESSYYGQAYDYYSVMHYDSLAFSKNGFETLVAKRPEMTAVIGSAIDFSPIDLLKINKLYNCPAPNTIDISQISGNGWQGGGMGPRAPLPQVNLPLPPPPPLPTNPAIAIVGECSDRTNLCWRWLDRCRSYFFEKIMKEFCALSCGYCVPTNAVSKAAPAIPLQPTLSIAEGPEGPMPPLYQRFG
uniref:Zinc metalloproteinase nas-8 n=1 Tax=Steinernema carpocapsae TaxID=34508 RepID=NAS8_STECR|nr:RecName: Full=Zinc metalloproteinase nas-8; AltName: Full=Nematode astacin 8; AltName: Full=Sc-AST; Flags: Precursor [Steinernema carpocapsae]ACZ98149.1 astacin protease precursor [Steinernema carpocapsae]